MPQHPMLNEMREEITFMMDAFQRHMSQFNLNYFWFGPAEHASMIFTQAYDAKYKEIITNYQKNHLGLPVNLSILDIKILTGAGLDAVINFLAQKIDSSMAPTVKFRMFKTEILMKHDVYYQKEADNINAINLEKNKHHYYAFWQFFALKDTVDWFIYAASPYVKSESVQSLPDIFYNITGTTPECIKAMTTEYEGFIEGHRDDPRDFQTYLKTEPRCLATGIEKFKAPLLDIIKEGRGYQHEVLSGVNKLIERAIKAVQDRPPSPPIVREYQEKQAAEESGKSSGVEFSSTDFPGVRRRG